jgi:hypothetical protein
MGMFFSPSSFISFEIKVARIITAVDSRIVIVSIVVIYYYYSHHHHHHHRVSHFSALAGKYSPILGFSNQQD